MRKKVDIEQVFAAMPGLFLVLLPDAEFTIVAASDDYLAATHTDRSILGRPLFEVFPDNPALENADGKHNLRASLDFVLATRRPHTMAVQRYDVRLSAAEGGGFEERYWLPINAPVLDQDRRVEYIIHRVDDAAAKANRDAIAILESIAEGFYTLDRHWRFAYVNQEAHRVLGHEPGELEGKVLWQVYPDFKGTAFEENYQRTMQSREKTSFAAYYEPHDRWYEVTAFPAAEGVSVYFRDVSEQQKVREQHDALVAESERQRRIYETALNSISDFIYVFDLEHRVIYANAALLKTWGIDDARGKRLLDIGYEPWDADFHEQEMDRVIASGSPLSGEVPYTGTNGTRIYEYIFAPVLGTHNDVVAVAGTTRDITERQRLTQRLLESQRLEAIGTLAGGIAHDFNNMLAAILGNVALAKMEMLPESPAVERLQLVHRAAERARSLVRQILTFSRRGPKLLAAQALQPLLNEAVALLRSTLPPTVHLKVAAAQEPAWARLDGAHFQQMVVNLCTNSWQALDNNGGEIRVLLESCRLASPDAAALNLQAGEHIRLRVEDDGHGIDESVRERIFEPFFTTKPVGQGTGLGLAVVHGFVTESGGVIHVESEPGQGTSVVVYLPLIAEPPDDELAEVAIPVVIPRLQTAHVLYVDDDEVVSLTAAALLSQAGYQVTCASDGVSALTTLRGAPGRFAIVVTDVNMPGMSGLAVAECLRSESPDIAVIVTSGLVTDDMQASAQQLGIVEVLPKEELLERLVAAIQRELAR